jgi:thymidine kinase
MKAKHPRRKDATRMARGALKLIVGNMFANKTGRLMQEIETLREFGRKKIWVLKPDIDTRSGKGFIKDYHGKTMEAHEVPVAKAAALFNSLAEKESEVGTKFHIVAIDEVQFYATDSGFFQVVDDMLSRGSDVMAAGLALNFKREPFGSTLSLVGLC